MSPQLFFPLESTLDRGTAARNEGNLDNPLQPPVNTPAAKRQSESGLNPAPPSSDRYVSFKFVIYNYLHFSFSEIRRLERKYKDLEREVACMKRKMESNILIRAPP